MNGIIIEVIGGETVWLLVVSTDSHVLTRPIEHRCMTHIVEGVGVSTPTDLIGREVVLADDGLTIAFS